MDRSDIIINIYKQYGSKDYIGENMTQIEHALQCAYYAKQKNYDKDIIIAALLHDIGHIIPQDNETMANLGVLRHENKGAEFLKKLNYSDKICSLVRNHVDAKRYLCTKNDSYTNKLSDASLKTIKYQGGLMTNKELLIFEQNKYFEESLQIRYLDDMGKQTGNIDYGNIDEYRDLLL